MRKILYKILLAVNILFALSLVFSYLAVHINPAKFALPAIFGLAYPYLLLINIIFIVIWILRLRFEALISVIAIAAGLAHFSNYLKITKPGEDKTDTFSILSYNIRLFNYFEGQKNPNSEKRILEFLKSRQPDIICLQELYIAGNPELKERAIKTALGGNYFSHMKLIESGKNRFYGIITLSKFTVIDRGEIVHPQSPSLSIYTDIIIKEDTFRIFNNHLQSFRLKSMERSLFNELKLSSEEKERFDEIKNISSSLRKGFVKRASQAETVKDHINNTTYPVIVAGDFNDTPVSWSYRKIRKGLNDSFVRSGYGAGFTYKGNYPPNRIDYILYDNALESRYFDILKVRFSDHYPIVAYFRSLD